MANFLTLPVETGAILCWHQNRPLNYRACNTFFASAPNGKAPPQIGRDEAEVWFPYEPHNSPRVRNQKGIKTSAVALGLGLCSQRKVSTRMPTATPDILPTPTCVSQLSQFAINLIAALVLGPSSLQSPLTMSGKVAQILATVGKVSAENVKKSNKNGEQWLTLCRPRPCRQGRR